MNKAELEKELMAVEERLKEALEINVKKTEAYETLKSKAEEKLNLMGRDIQMLKDEIINLVMKEDK